jgi:hypothetical protein
MYGEWLLQLKTFFTSTPGKRVLDTHRTGKLGELQRWAGRCGQKRNLSTLPRINKLVHHYPGELPLLRSWVISMLETAVPARRLGVLPTFSLRLPYVYSRVSKHKIHKHWQVVSSAYDSGSQPKTRDGLLRESSREEIRLLTSNLDTTIRIIIQILKTFPHLGSLNSSVGIVTGWTARVRFQAVQDYLTASRLALGPIQPPIQGYRGLFPQV